MNVTRGFIRDMVVALNATANDNNSQLAVDLFNDYFGKPDRIYQVRDKPLCPNGLVLSNPEAFVLWVGGVRDNAMRIAIAQGWSNPTAVNNNRGYNPWAMQNALDTFWPYLPVSMPNNKPIILVGHSGGSMIVSAVNELQRSLGGQIADAVILTGAPRARVAAGNATWPASQYFRFMALGDTVTILPPRMDEMPYAVLAAAGLTFPSPVRLLADLVSVGVPVAPVSFWPSFVHSPGGQTILPQGLPVDGPDPLPNPLAWSIDAAMVDILDRFMAAPAHNLGWYVELLNRWVNKFGTGDPQDEFGIAGEPSLPWQDEEFFILPVDPGGNITLPNEGGRIMGQPNPIQTGTMPNPEGGVMGAIYLDGELVAKFPSRAKARTAASRLNKFLAKLPGATEVSLGGFVAGCSSYLNRAAVGGGVDKRPVKVVA